MPGVALRNFIFACRCGNIDKIKIHVSRINTGFAAEDGTVDERNIYW